MTDLLNQARNSNNRNGKKMWTMEETLTLIVLKSRGLTVREIVDYVGHSEHSIRYRLNRWLRQFETTHELLTHYKIQDKTVEEIEKLADDFIAKKD